MAYYMRWVSAGHDLKVWHVFPRAGDRVRFTFDLPSDYPVDLVRGSARFTHTDRPPRWITDAYPAATTRPYRYVAQAPTTLRVSSGIGEVEMVAMEVGTTLICTLPKERAFLEAMFGSSALIDSILAEPFSGPYHMMFEAVVPTLLADDGVDLTVLEQEAVEDLLRGRL